MIDASYFDGRSSRAVAVQLQLEDDALRIIGADLLRTVPLAQVSVSAAPGRTSPLRLALADGALCEIAAGSAAADLLAALGRPLPLAERLVAHPGRLLAVLAAFVFILAVAYRWGVPLAADVLVDHLSPRLEARLGEAALRGLDEAGAFQPSALAAARQEEIRRAMHALQLPPGIGEFHIEFRRFGAPNAFALPGGTIVVGDELVSMAEGNPDGLRTVLGHELGHVYYRHSTRSLLRGALLSALAFWYLGDFSSAAAGVVGGVTAMQYSRQAEHDADLFALHLMQANGVSTHGAAVLLGKLAAGAAGEQRPRAEGRSPRADAPAQGRPRMPEYLSTHPDIDDRIALFENGSRAPAQMP